MRKIVLIIYEVFIFAPIFILATIITAIMVMIGCAIGEPKFWSCYPPRYWSKLACRLALCSINVENRGKQLDTKQSYVFIANHQGAYDIFLMYGYLGHDIKWVQKKELRKIPFVGKASEIAGHVFVDQSNRKSMIDTIKKAKEQLTEGTSIAIFPEGARTKTGKMDKFKRGAFIIAKEMGLPIVPVTINGPFDVMKINTYIINSGKLELIIHKPIPTTNITDEEIPDLMNKCHTIIHSALWEKDK